MEVRALPLGDKQIVQGYAKGGFRVSDREWRGAIIVLPTRTLSWEISGLGGLDADSFAPIREADDPAIDLILIGTGSRLALLPAALRKDLRAMGFAFDAMDTGAACRTYNVLIGEERRVAAALIPID